MGTVAEQYFVRQDDSHVGQPAGDLEETWSDVAYVSRILHRVESGDELSAETLSDLCVCIYNAERRLATMKEAEGRAQ
jgi:hypothetical protein